MNAPGDEVLFISAQKGHNAATIDEMLPEGAEAFKSKLGTEFAVTLTAPGRYGIKCSPHYAMGMMILIDVPREEYPRLRGAMKVRGFRPRSN